MTSGRSIPRSPLDDIEDAFLDDILRSSEGDLTADFAEEGHAADDVVVRMQARLAAAEEDCARSRMDDARRRLADFNRNATPGPIDLSRQRERLAAMRAGAPAASGMMMAARKGQGLSERDEDGLLGDLEDLQRISDETRGDGKP